MMSKTGITSGEWRAEKNSVPDVLATGEWGEDIIICGVYEAETEEMTQANARALAAVPHMIRALREIANNPTTPPELAEKAAAPLNVAGISTTTD
jgi:hypothetical protein